MKTIVFSLLLFSPIVLPLYAQSEVDDTLKADVHELKTDVQELKTDVLVIKTDLKNLKENVTKGLTGLKRILTDKITSSLPASVYL